MGPGRNPKLLVFSRTGSILNFQRDNLSKSSENDMSNDAREKVCNCLPGLTQTSLYIDRRRLEAFNLDLR